MQEETMIINKKDMSKYILKVKHFIYKILV